MWKVFCFVIAVLLCITGLDARLDSELCKVKPMEKHCLIEWAVRDRWPHQVRYVFDWSTQKCFEIRWSNNCNAVPSPPETNNFESEADCLNECGGWA